MKITKRVDAHNRPIALRENAAEGGMVGSHKISMMNTDFKFVTDVVAERSRVVNLNLQ